ncbi:MAG TPA: ROK family protein [Cyclobacteriaceae bacterium]|nr:ROK family protein [Cyclobacteriaceae bacterium]
MDLANPKVVLDKLESVVESKNYLHKIKIIKHLYVRGSNTASNIGQQVGISLPTVSLLLADLLDDKLVVKEGRGASQGGRKPDLYGLGDDSFYIVAIDLSKYSARVAIYNSKNTKVSEVQQLKISLGNDAETLNKLHRFTLEAIKKSKVSDKKIIAIGVSMPGLVDSKTGINHTYLKAGKKPLKDQLEKLFGKKVFVDNDARAMTLAEFRFGHPEKQKNVLGIFVDWGIGLGIIIDGKLYRGSSGFAGEFSHSPLFDAKEISCTCGKRGCLETVASGTAVVRMGKEAIAMKKGTILANMAREKGGDYKPEWVVEAALAGDHEAISILSEAGMNLGRGIAILIQLLNPGLIILGGTLSEAKNYVLTPIQQALNIYSMPRLSEKTEIRLSALGKEVGLKGAVAIVHECIFEDAFSN